MSLASDSSAGATPLWKLVVKINTDDGGLENVFFIAKKDKPTARTLALGITKRIQGLLPTDAEIFTATIHQEDGKRDGFLIPDYIGAGTYGTLLAVPAPTVMNQFRDSILIRRETPDGIVTSINFAPYPDPIVTGSAVVAPITSVQLSDNADPGEPVATDVYATRFLNFLKYLCYATEFVQSGFTPGGTYKHDKWENMYVERTSTKKGGRVFIK